MRVVFNNRYCIAFSIAYPHRKLPACGCYLASHSQYRLGFCRPKPTTLALPKLDNPAIELIRLIAGLAAVV